MDWREPTEYDILNHRTTPEEIEAFHSSRVKEMMRQYDCTYQDSSEAEKSTYKHVMLPKDRRTFEERQRQLFAPYDLAYLRSNE